MATLILTIFLVYYLSIIITGTYGPYGLFNKFRSLKEVEEIGIFDCLSCVVFWIALVSSLIIFDHNQLLYALGISGIVIFIDRIIDDG